MHGTDCARIEFTCRRAFRCGSLWWMIGCNMLLFVILSFEMCHCIVVHHVYVNSAHTFESVYCPICRAVRRLCLRFHQKPVSLQFYKPFFLWNRCLILRLLNAATFFGVQEFETELKPWKFFSHNSGLADSQILSRAKFS